VTCQPTDPAGVAAAERPLSWAANWYYRLFSLIRVDRLGDGLEAVAVYRA